MPGHVRTCVKVLHVLIRAFGQINAWQDRPAGTVRAQERQHVFTASERLRDPCRQTPWIYVHQCTQRPVRPAPYWPLLQTHSCGCLHHRTTGRWKLASLDKEGSVTEI